MAIYAKSLNGKQRSWMKLYEDETTFEPLHQDELDQGIMTFAEVAKANIRWFESWKDDAYGRISSNVPN